MKLLLAKVAWDHPPTIAGYRRLVIRRALWLVGLGVPFLLCLVCLFFDVLRQGALLFLMGMIGFATWVPWVTIAFIRRRRVAAILRSYPWHELPCHYPRRASGNPATIAISFCEGYSPVLRIIPFPVSLAHPENTRPELIWFAGDPRYGGVVSPVGGHYPVRVVPDKVPAEGWHGGDDVLASRVGLRRRSGKGTQT
ncbi:hypothetical protein [Streptomyces sp. LN699]|uniref:hypothetical protein n=1 Tax=Streptomyces sp. LN699 TaxID=3112981 RepID=UPI00371014A5